MRIVCISDTHLQQDFSIPAGDVLIHAGDGTSLGTQREVTRWLSWIDAQPHRKKIVVAGNHDFLFERDPELIALLMPDSIDYLKDSGTRFRGVKFWGSPWQPAFNNWAFNLPRGHELRAKWDLIPNGTDVLITHSPPHGVLDQVFPRPSGWDPEGSSGSGPLGCEELAIRARDLRPKLHIFGHIHDSYGVEVHGETTFVNACICNEDYKATNQPIVIDLPKKGRHP